MSDVDRNPRPIAVDLADPAGIIVIPTKRLRGYGMPMTLRLSEAGERNLDHLVAATGQSKTQVVESALAEMAARTSHRAAVAASFHQTRVRDADLLDRLSR